MTACIDNERSRRQQLFDLLKRQESLPALRLQARGWRIEDA